jgi:hypothetical protein
VEYCHWRYDLNPKSTFNILSLYHKNNLIGYAILKKDTTTPDNDWQIMDWDLLSSFRDEKSLHVLFSASVSSAIESGAQSLCALASDSLSCEGLKKSGFSHRAVDDGFFLFAQEHVSRDVFDENQWFLSLCDTDESL